MAARAIDPIESTEDCDAALDNMACGMFEERANIMGDREVIEYIEQGGCAGIIVSQRATKGRYLHPDHLGTVQFVTDEHGGVRGAPVSFKFLVDPKLFAT